jgi:hypothetical protein
MHTQTTTPSSSKTRNPVAIALIAVSYSILFATRGWTAVRFDQLLTATGVNFVYPAGAVGLALVRVLGNMVFDHRAILSLACGIFVLFCALMGIMTGLKMLLRRRTVAAATGETRCC